MASAPSMFVSLECMSICKLPKGVGSGRYDCNILSCAWKGPRVLTGFLASTAILPSALLFCRMREMEEEQEPISFTLGNVFGSSLLHVACKRWQFCCSSSSISDAFDEVSPESLWENLRPTISYLPPKELELVHNSLKLAFEAHDGQKQRSGEPFINHPVEVARILGELMRPKRIGLGVNCCRITT